MQRSGSFAVSSIPAEQPSSFSILFAATARWYPFLQPRAFFEKQFCAVTKVRIWGNHLKITVGRPSKGTAPPSTCLNKACHPYHQETTQSQHRLENDVVARFCPATWLVLREVRSLRIEPMCQNAHPLPGMRWDGKNDGLTGMVGDAVPDHIDQHSSLSAASTTLKRLNAPSELRFSFINAIQSTKFPLEWASLAPTPASAAELNTLGLRCSQDCAPAQRLPATTAPARVSPPRPESGHKEATTCAENDNSGTTAEPHSSRYTSN